MKRTTWWLHTNYLTPLCLSFLIDSCTTGGSHEEPVRQLGECQVPRKGWGAAVAMTMGWPGRPLRGAASELSPGL